jgi:hypothetical protein
MQFKGSFAKGLLVALVLTLIPVVAFSAQKITPGSTCKVYKQKVTHQNKVYTCVKSGKKLVWNKGVAKPTPQPTPTAIGDPAGAVGGTPTPTPSPTPSATSSPTPTLSPTPTVVPIPFEPKTLDDLILHPESISYWAWAKSSQQISSSLNVGSKVTIILGPNTLLPTKFSQTAIDQVTRLHLGFTRPSVVTIIYHNFQDISWAQQEWANISLNPQANEATNNCNFLRCWSGVAEIDLKGNGFILIASEDPATSRNRSSQESGTMEAHEFSHTIQMSQFVGTSKQERAYCCIKAYMPWWMVEGNATFTQAAATFSASYTDYLKERSRIINELQVNSNSKFTQQWFQEYLDTSTTIEWNKPENSWRMYDVGFLVNEALASIYGPNINMQLFKDVANGKTWEQAFEANIGVSWSNALPKLTSILSGIVGH